MRKKLANVLIFTATGMALCILFWFVEIMISPNLDQKMLTLFVLLLVAPFLGWVGVWLKRKSSPLPMDVEQLNGFGNSKSGEKFQPWLEN